MRFSQMPFTQKIVIAILFATAGAAGAIAQEKLTLSAPVYATLGATDFRVESIYLKRDTGALSPAEVRAIFREVDANAAFVPNGRSMPCTYSGQVAADLIATLNTLNLSTTSLEKRVTTRCQTDGKIGAGAVSGVPQ